MWLIRSLFLGALTLTSYRALSAQPDEWPFCGNFANEKGYPIGCKSSAFEVCAAQTDECKSLVCGSIDKEFRYCGEACDNDPTAISIETNGLTCYCAEAEEKACINVNPILSTFVDVRTPQPKSSRKKGPFKPENVWGAIVKIPRQKLMPVFCYGAKDTCGPTVIGVCQIGPCPSNMCHFEEKCYYIAEYNGSPEASCDVGKPAAVETAEERQFLFFMLTDTRFLNDETTKFATAGMIEASESEIIWNGWELDMDYSVVNLEDASVQNYDQVLYLQKSGDMLMIWGLDDINSGAMKAVVCKTSTSGNSAEQCDTSTTTTSENGGETTTTAKDPTTTTTGPITTTAEPTTTTKDPTTIKTDPTTTTTEPTTTTNDPTTTKTDPTTTTNDPTTTKTDPTATTTEPTTTTNDPITTTNDPTTTKTDPTTTTTEPTTTTNDPTTTTTEPTTTTNDPTTTTTEPTTTTNDPTTTKTDPTTTTNDPTKTTNDPTTTTNDPTTTKNDPKTTTMEPTTTENGPTTTTTESTTTKNDPTTVTTGPTTKDSSSVTTDPTTTDPTTPSLEDTTITDTTITDGSSESTEDNSTPSTPPTEPEECPGKCIQADQYDEVWTCCGQTVCKRPCPLDADGNAFWSCGTSQYKSKWPNYEECNSPWVNNLTSLIEEEKVTSFTLMMDVDQFVKDSSMFGHEMETSLNFSRVSLDLLFKEQELAEDPPATKLHQRKFLLEMAMGVIDKLLALTKPWEQLREYQKIELGWNMNKLAEMFGFAVTKKAKSIGEVYNMTSKLDHTHWEAQFLKHKFGGKSDSIVRFPMNVDPKKSSIIIKDLPAKMKKYPDVSLESVGQHLSMEFAENMFPASINSFRERKKKLNSGMVSLTLYGKSREPVHEFATEGAVVVVFKHARQSKGPAYQKIWHELFPGEEPTAIQGTGRCAYWNESLGVNGEWDTAGCRLVNSSHWYTVCECNHLSSFALLMDVHEYIAKDQIMEILSIVCSSLSVISLILTLFVLHTLKGIQGERNSIGKHLCLCLLIGHLMALTVLDRSYFKLSQEVCVGVAVTLHYVFLAAFMWMAVEGHHLYRLVVRVFDTGRDMSRIYLCVGYGTPILIVAITCIVTGSLQDTGYANDELCWLSSPSYIWAFMGPVLFLTLINLGVLVLAMRVAVTAGTQQKKSFMDRAKTWIKGLFSLSALLGVTWILGFFYIQFDHNFAYAFIALNGLQGVFIFLTRVVFNEQVKTTMRRGAKQRAMMKRFYSLAWKGRNSGSSFHPSSWFFGTSTSSQLDLTSSASTSYWANTTSRRRSSANHSTNDSDVMEIQPSSGQNLYNNLIHVPNIPEKTINTQSWLKRKTSKEEEIEPSSWSNWNSGDVQQIWNNIREPDTLSQIPEEDYDDVYENIEEQKNYHNYKKY